MVIHYKRNLKIYSRQLRLDMTICERILWNRLRRKQILNVQFYRQKPIGPYILDFYSNFPKIAIELDGGHHFLPEQMEKDIDRDLYLESLMIKPLRFSNIEVLQHCDAVILKIIQTVEDLIK
jgi:very-short-patch-repair endonuclease